MGFVACVRQKGDEPLGRDGIIGADPRPFLGKVDAGVCDTGLSQKRALDPAYAGGAMDRGEREVESRLACAAALSYRLGRRGGRAGRAGLKAGCLSEAHPGT